MTQQGTIALLFAFFLGSAPATEFTTTVKPFLEAHCVKCHGPEKQKGRLRLDTLSDDFADSQTASTWIEVRDNLNLGEMPPEDETRPDGEDIIAVSKWIGGELRAMQARANSTGGQALLRRLSRTEYTNTVRDLLKVRFEKGEGPREILPPDGKLEGFDKVSKALLVDPSLMENYFAAASFVADKAITIRPPRVATHSGRYEFETIPQTQGISYVANNRTARIVEDGIILYSMGARTAGHPRHPYNDEAVPVIGKYKVRVRASASWGEKEEPVYLEMRWATMKKRFRVDAPIDEPKLYEWEVAIDQIQRNEFQVFIVPENQLRSTDMDSVAMRTELEAFAAEGNVRDSLRVWQEGAAEGIYTVFQQTTPTEQSRNLEKLPKLFLDYIEVEGPLQEEFPPESTTYLYPDGYDNPDAKTPGAVRKTFSRLLPRAFRRPVSEEEIDEHVQIVENEITNGLSYHEAMKAGLVAMLCSPEFLFLLEPRSRTADTPAKRGILSRVLGKRKTENANGARQLNDYELASRLSYFLWSSMPDDELFELASQGNLSAPAKLRAQANRMLKDPKAEALVTDFANQWLRIAEFDQFRPDEGLYRKTYYAPQFAGIGNDMEEEARAFFREILQNDEPVTNFLDSDWTMANERLATYYGIGGITGEQFRRVSLPADSPRGGLIGMAGFHKWGADGNRTKPVERGKYILDVLFNDPPDPPPPNAGEVEPNVQGERLTVRERLLGHQEVEACAGCHRTIDPYGLAMENFNAVGLWRDMQDGEDRYMWVHNPKPIINEGTLPNGKNYTSYTGFKSLLLEQEQRFKRGLAERLLIYALGRSLEPTDDATITELGASLEREGDTLRNLITNLVLTDAFLTK